MPIQRYFAAGCDSYLDDHEQGDIVKYDDHIVTVDRLKGLLREVSTDSVYGCRFCDTRGILRKPNNPDKDHDADCLYVRIAAELSDPPNPSNHRGAKRLRSIPLLGRFLIRRNKPCLQNP